MKPLSMISGAIALTAITSFVAPQVQAKGKPANAGPPASSQPSQPQTSQTPKADQPPSGSSVTSLTCSAGYVTSNPLGTGSSVSYSECLAPVRGNDVTSSIDENLTAFLNQNLGEGWVFDSKYEGGRSTSGPNSYGFSWVQSGKGTGTWSVSQTLSSPFVISLKAGTTYTSYYVEGGSDTLSGTWATFDQKDLSHASIFVGRSLTSEPPKTTVPEPAAGAALGLFSLAAFGRTQQKSSQDS